MPLWTHTGLKFEKCPWYRAGRPDTAVIYGCGQSVHFQCPVNGTRFVQNHAHRVVTPHIWIALDKPADFQDALRKPGFPKILRASYHTEVVNGLGIVEYPDTYFIDVQEKGLEGMFFGPSNIDTNFIWAKNTMATTLHLALWMGFRDLVLHGIDLQGAYFDGRALTPEQSESQKRLHQQEYEFLAQFGVLCRQRGIRVRCTSGDPAVSRLATLFEVAHGD
jgi:hypothetical protein